MSADSGDKQFEPTESKLRKARQEGDVPRSTELQSALMYLGLWFALVFAATWGCQPGSALPRAGWGLNPFQMSEDRQRQIWLAPSPGRLGWPPLQELGSWLCRSCWGLWYNAR